MKAVMKNVGILAVSLLIGSTAFGQRGVSVRVEGKTSKPGAPAVPGKVELMKIGKAYEGMKNNPVAQTPALTEVAKNASKAELLEIETNQINEKVEVAESVALAAGSSVASKLLGSYRSLAEAATSKDGGAKLAQLAQEGMSWKNCTACQQGLVNTFNEATNIANRGNHSIRTAFEGALEINNKLEKFKESCPAYR